MNQSAVHFLLYWKFFYYRKWKCKLLLLGFVELISTSKTMIVMKKCAEIFVKALVTVGGHLDRILKQW